MFTARRYYFSTTEDNNSCEEAKHCQNYLVEEIHTIVVQVIALAVSGMRCPNDIRRDGSSKDSR